MKIQFQCPKCENNITEECVEGKKEISCNNCKKKFPLQHFPNEDPNELRSCPLCEAGHLYIQKKFPKKIGLGIVIVAAIITLLWDHKYYFTLIVTALIDWILYKRCSNITKCYLCEGEYSDYQALADRGGFDLNIYERYRTKSWVV